MKLCRRKLVAERRADKVGIAQKRACLVNRSALRENPRNKLKLCDVCFIVNRLSIDRIADKIKPRNAEALLVDCIVIERIAVCNVRRSYYRIVAFDRLRVFEVKGIVPRSYRDFISVGKLVV